MSMFSSGELDRLFYRRGIALMLALLSIGAIAGAVIMMMSTTSEVCTHVERLQDGSHQDRVTTFDCPAIKRNATTRVFAP